jgi:hypothetical protein
MDVPALIDRHWAEHATCTDPSVHAARAGALLAHTAAVQARRPGARVLRTSAVDAHHDVARFAWHVVQADGRASPEGLDVALLTADGARPRRGIDLYGPPGALTGHGA